MVAAGDDNPLLLDDRREKRGVASCSRFCTCTCATSGSVPWEKLRVIVAAPLLSLFDEKYSKLSSPPSCCSITCTTVLATVCAEAPG